MAQRYAKTDRRVVSRRQWVRGIRMAEMASTKPATFADADRAEEGLTRLMRQGHGPCSRRYYRQWVRWQRVCCRAMRCWWAQHPVE